MKALVTQSLYLSLVAVLLTSLHAQSSSATQTPPPLGLLRLKGATQPNEAAPLTAAKFSVDDLSATGVAGASKARKNNADYLALDAGKEWSRPLRGSAREITFISFQLHGSETTIIDVAGARLGVTASPVSGSLQLMADDSAGGALDWKSLNLHVPLAYFGGQPLATLPVLTIRLDPAAGTWDLYANARLVADNLPLIAAKRDVRQFTVKAGGAGAWLAGLVLADENPLYEDANANGIDDAFEKEKRAGMILPANAVISERTQLARQWMQAQRAQPPPALFLKRPLADGPQ